MINYKLEKKDIEKLNGMLEDKNDLSILNRFEMEKPSKDDMGVFKEMGILDDKDEFAEQAKESLEILAKPHATVNIIFTGGTSAYEHSINYDNLFKNYVSLTIAANDISINNNENNMDIVDTLEDFVGNSNLKSVSFSNTYSMDEAYVVAVLLDMERKATLRSFIDEMPYGNNPYSVNMIWRIMNSTSTNIQWFVHILNKIVGEQTIFTQKQVKDAVDKLVEKGDVILENNQYKASAKLALLASRMIIVDNVVSVQSSTKDDTGVKSTGFTCVQSGLHDLMFIDFNDDEVKFETISSAKLLEYLKSSIDCEKYLSKI